jgi:hypothetical protein
VTEYRVARANCVRATHSPGDRPEVSVRHRRWCYGAFSGLIQGERRKYQQISDMAVSRQPALGGLHEHSGKASSNAVCGQSQRSRFLAHVDCSGIQRSTAPQRILVRDLAGSVQYTRGLSHAPFLSYGHDEHIDFALRLKRDLKEKSHEVLVRSRPNQRRIKPGAVHRRRQNELVCLSRALVSSDKEGKQSNRS